MPSTKHWEDPCICGSSQNGYTDDKSEKSSKNDVNRLKKLEKEVCRLRDEVEKIKWQRAAAETAIERAIARGEVALGGRYKLLVQHDPSGNRDDREARRKNDETTSSMISSRYHGAGGAGGEIAHGDNKRGKDNECGQYTIG